MSDLKSGIDGNHLVILRDNIRIVYIIHRRSETHLIIVEEIVELFGAQSKGIYILPGSTFLIPEILPSS